MKPLSRSRRSTAGFTLIELIAAIAMLSVLISMLPAVQRAREAANRARAEQTLRQIGAWLETDYKQNGKFPAGMEEILAKALNFTNSAAGRDGYRITAAEISPKRVRLLSEPLAGVTGSFTGVLEVTALSQGVALSQLNFVPTPGADAGRKKMQAEAYDAAARAFGQLMNLALPAVQKDAQGRVRTYLESPVSLQQAYQTLAGTSGSLNFRSVRDGLALVGDAPVKNTFTEFWLNFTRAVQLGANGEDWASLPGVSGLPAVQSSDRLLNFTNIAGFARRAIADPVVALKAGALLDQAAAADAVGNLALRQSAVDALTLVLRAEQSHYFNSGKTQPALNFFEAEAVIALAGSM